MFTPTLTPWHVTRVYCVLGFRMCVTDCRSDRDVQYREISCIKKKCLRQIIFSPIFYFFRHWRIWRITAETLGSVWFLTGISLPQTSESASFGDGLDGRVCSLATSAWRTTLHYSFSSFTTVSSGKTELPPMWWSQQGFIRSDVAGT